MMGYKIIPPVPGAQPAAGGGSSPTTPLLDSFTDANGTFLQLHAAEGGTNWVSSNGTCQIQSNAALSASDASEAVVWNVVYNAASEAWVDLASLTGTGPGIEISTRVSSTTYLLRDGYYGQCFLNNALFVGRVDDGVNTDLADDAGAYSFIAGDQLWLKSTSGNDHILYVEGSQKLSVNEATYTAGGRLGLQFFETASNAATADNFGGGSL